MRNPDTHNVHLSGWAPDSMHPFPRLIQSQHDFSQLSLSVLHSASIVESDVSI